jgi:hypothetical protein
VGPEDQLQVEMLVSMGFEADMALFAFCNSGNDVGAAAEMLLGGGVPADPYAGHVAEVAAAGAPGSVPPTAAGAEAVSEPTADGSDGGGGSGVPGIRLDRYPVASFPLAEPTIAASLQPAPAGSAAGSAAVAASSPVEFAANTAQTTPGGRNGLGIIHFLGTSGGSHEYRNPALLDPPLVRCFGNVDRDEVDSRLNWSSDGQYNSANDDFLTVEFLTGTVIPTQCVPLVFCAPRVPPLGLRAGSALSLPIARQCFWSALLIPYSVRRMLPQWTCCWCELTGRWCELTGRWCELTGRWCELTGQWCELTGRWCELTGRWCELTSR